MANKYLLSGMILSSILLGQIHWQENGIALRQGMHIEWQRTTTSSEPGTVIIVWSDVRNGIRDVYAQKIDTSGTLLWGMDGLAVTTSPGRQEDPVAITDGDGGAFIAWVDYRGGDMSDIYIQHINSDGQMLMNFDGEALCVADSVQISISMCIDSLGGAYVVWQDKRFGVDEDIYGTHIDSAHNIIAAGEGIAIAFGSGAQSEKSLEYAGNGQALIVWKNAYSNNTDIFSQRLNPDMTFPWTEKLAVSDEPLLESQPRTTILNGDTNIVVWQITDVIDQIRYQLVTADGLVFPVAQKLTNDPEPKSSPRVKRDTQGNAFVIWEDYRRDPIEYSFFAQKVLSGGDIAWDSSAVAVDDGITRNGQARLAPDETGGLWCSWESGVFPEIDIKVQHLSSAGALLLSNFGQIAFNLPGYQFSPILMPDGGNGSFITIGDQPTGSISLRTQRLTSTGELNFSDLGMSIMPGMDGGVNYASAYAFDQESTYLLWEDGRNGKRQYGLVVDTSGLKDIGFNTANGTVLVGSTVYSLPDENEPDYLLYNNNIFVSRYDISGGSKSLRINKLDDQLANLWDPDGLTVFASLADQTYSKLFPIGNDLGVIWSEIRNFIDYGLYLQRFDENGAIELASDGVVLADASFRNDFIQAVFPTPNDEFVIIWMEDVWHAQDLYAQCFTADGLVAAGWPFNGVPICTAADDQRNAVSVVVNETIGIFIIWEDLRSGTLDLYCQVLGWDGSLGLDANGLPVTLAPNDQSNPVVSYDPAYGRALVVWEDFRDSSDINLQGQFFEFDSPGLVDTNFAISDIDKHQVNPFVQNVYPGTFLITWEDERGVSGATPVVSGGSDIYAQVYQIGLGLAYPDGGIPIVQEYHNQLDPKLVKLYTAAVPEEDRWLIYWRDLRSSGKEDIIGLYSQLIRVTDALATSNDSRQPVEFKLHSAYPNPFNSSIRFSIDIPFVAPITLSIYNLLGQTVYQEKILPLRTGNLQINWDGRSQFWTELSSGLYFYTIRLADASHTGKITYLK